MRRKEFEELARRYQRDIFAAAMRLTGNYADAEDLAQEAFVKAYMAFDQFQLGTNFRAWLLRILTNTHINRYRRTKRTPETIAWEDYTLQGERQDEFETPAPPRPESEILYCVPDEVVGPALHELPEEFREAVILSDIHELSYKEIAHALNIPLGTVRSRIFRGRKLLRETLADYARARRMI
jgi:RNA polymerase sigma-70 factor (ECF subfamily)